MSANKLQDISGALKLTAVFRGVLSSPVVERFLAYCAADAQDKPNKYGELASAVYDGGGNLTECVKKAIYEDENVYVKALARDEDAGEKIVAAAKRELGCFSRLGALTRADFAADLDIDMTELPDFDSSCEDFFALFTARAAALHEYGYGIFASHCMFRLSDERKIEPIVSADKRSITSFVGYEEERGKVRDNTEAFVKGFPAANVLLCGDAGTGKSSTVKAVANEFFSRGIRLIELRKDQLSLLPLVMGKISANPLKFIIFIDDLSFNSGDDNFSMLKAALEGSASAKADNAVIYATSNRRHIVKETFSERSGDDVHRNDTMQENLSLSERFGLVVLFSRPDKKLYLQIVVELAERAGVNYSGIEVDAEAFALRKGNRSARAAEQFVESLVRARR